MTSISNTFSRAYRVIHLFLVACFIFSSGCKKYLDERPAKSLRVPSAVNELQAMLDNDFYMNAYLGVSYDEASADNYYFNEANYGYVSPESKAAYTWSNLVYDNYPNDWSNIYNSVNVTNIVLESLETIPVDPREQTSRANVRGAALFYRSLAFFQGVNIFAKAYDSTTAASDPGIALKLSSDITEKTTRASVQETFERILADLKESVTLLPDLPQHVLRPSRSAAFALLSRVYLAMGNYAAASEAAKSCLAIKDDLLDFNAEVDLAGAVPFALYNKEVLFEYEVAAASYAGIVPFYTKVDSFLFQSYAENDLRKAAYFDTLDGAGATFKGSYAQYNPFIGLATDELWLTLAECQARLGDYNTGINTLNQFLATRFDQARFIPFTASNSAEAVALILTERRKELLFRGTRWMDLKRLNKKGAGITLSRTVDGVVYTLPPNDPRYALPLPKPIVDISGMPQNMY